MIKYKSSKLLEDLNIEKGFEKERVKEIKTKLEKLKAPTITKSVIPKKIFVLHNKTQKILCLIEDLKNKKYVFLSKKLIVHVNHAFLGFYLCQSTVHKYYAFNNI